MNYALYREIITAGTHKAERKLPPRAMGLVIEWASRH